MASGQGPCGPGRRYPMSSLDAKRGAGFDGETGLLAAGVSLLFGVPAALWTVGSLGQFLVPRADGLPDGFWAVAVGMLTGTVAWRGVEILLVAIVAGATMGLLAWSVIIRHRRNRIRVRHDR